MAKNKLAGVMNTAVRPMESKEHEANERRWRAEEALRTITKAEEHKRDRGLMAEVRKCAREQMKTLSSVTGKKASGR